MTSVLNCIIYVRNYIISVLNCTILLYNYIASFLIRIQNEMKSLFVSAFQQTGYLIIKIFVLTEFCDFKMAVINWSGNWIEWSAINCGLKSYLSFQIELMLTTHLILKSPVWFQTKLHSTQFNYHYLHYYMKNFCKFIGLEQWYFSLIWNIYMWKLQTFHG